MRHCSAMGLRPVALTRDEQALSARMSELAARQGGVVSARSARALGAQTGDIRRLMSAGRWTRPRRAVYADTTHRSSSPASLHAALCAAALAALDPGVVASHLTAARLLGLPTPSRLPDEVTLTRLPPSHGNDAAGTRIHVAVFDDDDVVTVDGIPVLTGARMVIDCCHVLPPPDALAIADGAVRAGLTNPDELGQAAAAGSGIPYGRRAAIIAERVDGRAENWFESVSRWWLLEGGLPRPELQVPLYDRTGSVRARLDFLLVAEKVAGESDGRGKYEGPDGSVRLFAEKRREDWIRHEHGLEVVRWVPAEMAYARGRVAVVQRFREAIERARHRRAD